MDVRNFGGLTVLVFIIKTTDNGACRLSVLLFRVFSWRRNTIVLWKYIRVCKTKTVNQLKPPHNFRGFAVSGLNIAIMKTNDD